MLELIDYGVMGLIVFFGNLLGFFVAFKVAAPRLKKSLRGEAMNIGNQVGKTLAKTIEDVDIGEIAGQLGVGGAGAEALGGLGDMLGGEGGGIGKWLGLLSQLSGKNKGGGGSSGW